MPSNELQRYLPNVIVKIPIWFLGYIASMFSHPAKTLEIDIEMANVHRFKVNASDAKDGVAVHDLRYLPSRLLAALESADFNATEAELFLMDLHRLGQNVVDNGAKLGKIAPEQLLSRWLTAIGKDTQLPPARLKQALEVFNQNVGNWPLENLMQFVKQSSLHGSPLRAYLPLARSEKFQVRYLRDGNTFNMRFELPLRAFPVTDDDIMDYTENLDEDALAVSSLSVNFGAAKDDPQRVTYEFSVETKNPALLLQFPGQEQFEATARNNGFCTIEEVTEDNEEWALIKYIPSRPDY